MADAVNNGCIMGRLSLAADAMMPDVEDEFCGPSIARRKSGSALNDDNDERVPHTRFSLRSGPAPPPGWGSSGGGGLVAGSGRDSSPPHPHTHTQTQPQTPQKSLATLLLEAREEVVGYQQSNARLSSELQSSQLKLSQVLMDLDASIAEARAASARSFELETEMRTLKDRLDYNSRYIADADNRYSSLESEHRTMTEQIQELNKELLVTKYQTTTAAKCSLCQIGSSQAAMLTEELLKLTESLHQQRRQKDEALMLLDSFKKQQQTNENPTRILTQKNLDLEHQVFALQAQLRERDAAVGDNTHALSPSKHQSNQWKQACNKLENKQATHKERRESNKNSNLHSNPPSNLHSNNCNSNDPNNAHGNHSHQPNNPNTNNPNNPNNLNNPNNVNQFHINAKAGASNPSSNSTIITTGAAAVTTATRKSTGGGMSTPAVENQRKLLDLSASHETLKRYCETLEKTLNLTFGMSTDAKRLEACRLVKCLTVLDDTVKKRDEEIEALRRDVEISKTQMHDHTGELRAAADLELNKMRSQLEGASQKIEALKQQLANSFTQANNLHMDLCRSRCLVDTLTSDKNRLVTESQILVAERQKLLMEISDLSKVHLTDLSTMCQTRAESEYARGQLKQELEHSLKVTAELTRLEAKSADLVTNQLPNLKLSVTKLQRELLDANEQLLVTKQERDVLKHQCKELSDQVLHLSLNRPPRGSGGASATSTQSAGGGGAVGGGAAESNGIWDAEGYSDIRGSEQQLRSEGLRTASVYECIQSFKVSLENAILESRGLREELVKVEGEKAQMMSLVLNAENRIEAAVLSTEQKVFRQYEEAEKRKQQEVEARQKALQDRVAQSESKLDDVRKKMEQTTAEQQRELASKITAFEKIQHELQASRRDLQRTNAQLEAAKTALQPPDPTLKADMERLMTKRAADEKTLAMLKRMIKPAITLALIQRRRRFFHST